MSQVNFRPSLNDIKSVNSSGPFIDTSSLQKIEALLTKPEVERSDLHTAQKLLSPWIDKQFRAGKTEFFIDSELPRAQQEAQFSFVKAIEILARELQTQKSNTYPATVLEKVEAASQLVVFGGITVVFASMVAAVALLSGEE
jgi:hypothetical protein